MRTRKNSRCRAVVLQLGKGAALAVLAVAAQSGCTREFYREWANQDVSEAVFEKSRDPRWRMDMFSVEPGQLSRFADPYDQDAPPAPPDDVPTEALSPVPQWPSNRLIVPVEGTGYRDILEAWQREEMAAKGWPPDKVPSDPAVTGLPPNMGLGGVPVTPSTDTASRHGVDFKPFPGMADPYHPGRVIAPPPVPAAEEAEKAAATPTSGRPTAGFGTPPAGRPGTGGGLFGPPGGTVPVPPGVTPTAPTGLTPTAPTGLTPTPPGGTGPAGEGGPPGGSASVRPPGAPAAPVASAAAPSNHQAKRASTVTRIVRLQDDAPGDPIPAPRRRTMIPPPRPANPGPDAAGSTPIRVASGGPSAARPVIPPPRSFSNGTAFQPREDRGVRDALIARTRFQQEAGAPAEPPSAPATINGQPNTAVGQPPDSTQPPIPRPSRPGTLDANIRALPPVVPGTNQPLTREVIGEAGHMSPEQGAGLAGILVPEYLPMNEAEFAGLPKDYKPYKINMQQAWALALINARFYQFQLEALYLSALDVTLQRFSFEPQFYAGLSPLTPVPQGGFRPGFAGGTNFPNTFNYATRFAPSGQVSNLNLGTVAGFGKLFNTGGQVLLGFASELVFNFAGKNAKQPTVLSAIPISIVQPLLRGGGRAVVLEPLTLAERSLLYQTRAFTQFRQQFFVVTLTGGTISNFGQGFSLAGFSAGGNTDPTVGFLPTAVLAVQIEINRRNVAFYESLIKLYQELIQGEASGLSQLQVDQAMSNLLSARLGLFRQKVSYRVNLDQFKQQIGLPPDTPLILDQGFLGEPFYKVFDGVDAWQKRPDRKLEELPEIISQIPQLQDIDLDGRSVLGIYRNYRSTAKGDFEAEDEDGLEDLLQASVRIGLEYRLDLMNFRAQLYDAWRQIRVIANSLKGYLNVAINNNVFTGPYTTNPWAFLSNAKNFQLTINAELPLVRMTERNNFRTALITYQRARRTLMGQEDFLKNQLRGDLRSVHQAYITYEIAKRLYELNVRLKDQAFEQIVAPPQAGGGGVGQSANAATQTINLLNFQSGAFNSQLNLVSGYQNYQTQRLIFYRDIGTLPYEEWEAFRELFPSEYHGPIIGRPGGSAGPAAREEAPAPAVFGG